MLQGVRRFILVCIAGSILNGCAGWRWVERDDLAAVLSTKQPQTVRLALADSLLDVRGPAVEGDSLRGTAIGKDKARVSIAISEIDSMGVHGPTLTPMRIVAASAIALSIVFIVLANQQPSSR